MYEQMLSPKEKLVALVSWTTRNAVSRSMNIDRSNIRDLLSGKRGIGPMTRMRIDKAFNEAIGARFGVPALRFPTPFDAWLQDIRQTAGLAEEARKTELRNFYSSDKLSLLVTETFTSPGPDQETTVRRATMNIIGANINWRTAPFLTRGPAERKARVHAPIRAVEQFAAAANLLQHAMNLQGGPKASWSRPELQALIGYARFNQLGVLSEFRHERKTQNGFWSFEDDDILAHVQAAVDDIRNVFKLYPHGHPSRLLVAANTLVVASLIEDETLALDAWTAMALQEPRAASLKFLLPGHDRPLSESSQTSWVRQRFSDILPLPEGIPQ
jgi:hypothetical protein